MRNCIFDESNIALDSITKTFDLIWPITVSLWKMRCDIKGMMSENSNLTNKNFAALYNTGCKLHGVNYTRNFVDNDWEEQKTDIAFLLLNSSIALFEEWLSDLIRKYFPVYNGGAIDDRLTNERIKKCQFPATATNEFAAILSVVSPFMLAHIYPKYRNLKKRDYSLFHNMLYCFRVFKEMRNSYMHEGCKATHRFIGALSDYNTHVNNPCDLGTSVIPSFGVFYLGQKIVLDLDKAVFANEIILKMVVSIDAELSKTEAAERTIIDRMRNSEWIARPLPSESAKRQRRIKRLFTNVMKVPSPDNIVAAESFLLNNNLVSV